MPHGLRRMVTPQRHQGGDLAPHLDLPALGPVPGYHLFDEAAQYPDRFVVDAGVGKRLA
jgi:hypothetical protein